MPQSQLELLNVLSEIFKIFALPILRACGWNIEVYLVRGNYPYTSATVERISDGQQLKVTQNELKEWLEFRQDTALVKYL
jgi:hypothetical protein